MPPLSSCDTQLGFTAGLMQTIAVSKSKFSEWAEVEKANADAAAETYRQALLAEQTFIDKQLANLDSVQAQRGLSNENDASTTSSSEHNESIAARKAGLEERRAVIEQEISKLQNELAKKKKDIKGKAYL